jgi:uncharacterized protein (DUF697 family)
MKVIEDMNANIVRGLLLVGALAGSAASQAAAVDVTAVTTDIGAQIASVVAIGAGVLLVMVAVKAFRWVRSALS